MAILADPVGNNLLVTFIIDLVIQAAAFVLSAALKTDHFFDVSGGLTFAACFLNALLNRSDGAHVRQAIAVALSLSWCARLAGFLFLRIMKTGHDARFDEIKTHPGKLAGAFFGQIVWIWLTGLAVYIVGANPASSQKNLNALDIVGIVVWAIGYACEVTADVQKFNFKNKNPNRFMDQGIWRYSRHPNYFGEVLLWIGMFLLCINGFAYGWNWVSILSPVFVFVLLYFGSGVRMAETNADKRYGENPEYQTYKQRTSIFIPWFTKNLPIAISDNARN